MGLKTQGPLKDLKDQTARPVHLPCVARLLPVHHPAEAWEARHSKV